jgi:hypothetical protein
MISLVELFSICIYSQSKTNAAAFGEFDPFNLSFSVFV